RHGLVDNLHHPAADQLLVFHERDVRLNASGIAVHHEADRTGRREHGRLRVAIAMLLTEFYRIIPGTLRGAVEIRWHVALVHVAHRLAMLAHHARERLTILFVTGERAAMIAGDAG